ncbi:MAG: hypothetical protein HYZ51_01020 [Candidatus Doudnabacteria bacterium]|nr:hypothetical protein [Candidatus Doudnabacteria bacterium]
MIIYFIIILAIISRFIPHVPNFAPITAIAIFAGAHLPWKKAFGMTLAARLVSDIFLGLFSWPLMIAVYSSHLAGIILGLWIKRSQNHRWMKIAGSSLIASAIFFLITNLAFLYTNYPHNLSGIIQAYINGLPFLRGTLMGDIVYTSALFGGYEIVKVWMRRQHSSQSLKPNC